MPISPDPLDSPAPGVSPQSSPPPRQAGGVLIAAGLILGPIIGFFFGQISIGLIAGLVIGIIAAVVYGIRDRRKA
jgi:predicted lipid-binding transport protein (Tim44 family)